MMLTSRTKNIIKVAVLCLIVSLLSFILGAHVNSKPLSIFNKSNDGTKAYVQKIDDEKQLEANKDIKRLLEAMELIEAKYVRDVDREVLLNGAIKGMVESLEDPYSVYMTPAEFESFMISVDGAFEGVGLSLGLDEETGEVIVVSPIEGTPAQKAGIRPKDIIIKVDDVELKGKKLDDAVSLIRGPKGEKVTIYVKRQGVKDILKFDLVRDNIVLKTVNHEVLGNNIGYIKISSFDSHTADEFDESLAQLKKQSVKGLILDLRNNPGGSLYESVKVADRILGKGRVVYTEDRHKNILEEYYSDAEKIDMPLVVLVNENSASASEIVAGAIQDHKAGVLVGTKTFGKGSVQELEPFNDGSGMKLTIAKYYIPSGRSIDKVGIQPNIKVENEKNVDTFNIPRDKDMQLNKALEVVKSMIAGSK